jgi:hypothetical protein
MVKVHNIKVQIVKIKLLVLRLPLSDLVVVFVLSHISPGRPTLCVLPHI